MARNTNRSRPQVDVQERDEDDTGAAGRGGDDRAGRRERNGREQRTQSEAAQRHEHRTAKVVELIGSSSRSFEEAVKNALKDAAETTRGITGCQVEGFSIKCENGEITQYKASIKVAFGVERT